MIAAHEFFDKEQRIGVTVSIGVDSFSLFREYFFAVIYVIPFYAHIRIVNA
jgi:hypothetical protein